MTEIHFDENSLGDVHGKVAIVTGGASGIGKAIVELLQKRGSIVVFCDLDVAAGEQVVKDLGPNVEFQSCDVTKWKELLSLFTQTKQKHGHIDLVFANAGIVQGNEVFEDKLDENGELAEPYMPILSVNLISVIWTAKLAFSYFKSNSIPGGSLVISASSSSYSERPNLPLYSVTKHAVLGLMRALRQNAPSASVSVSCIAPGGTASGMVNAHVQEAMKARGIPVQEASYVALGAVFLASNKEWNGKSLVLIGSKATEVEGPITETMPLWYGKHNVELSNRAATVPVNKT